MKIVDLSRETLKIYWQVAKSQWLLFSLSILFIALGCVLEAVAPIYFKALIDGLSEKVDHRNIVSILVTILFLRIGRSASYRLYYFSASEYQANGMAKIYNHCFKSLQKHSFSYFNDNFVGSFVKKIKGFVSAFEVIGDIVFGDFLSLLISISLSLFVLYRLQPILAFIILAWMGLYIILSLIFAKFRLKYDLEKHKTETVMSSFLSDAITNNVAVKLFNGYRREVNRFFELINFNRRAKLFSWRLGGFFESGQSILMISIELAVIYSAVLLYEKDLITIGSFIMIQSYLINIFMRMWDFHRVIRRFFEALSEANEMTEILTTPYEITDDPQAHDLKVSEGAINFDAVGFKYKNGREIMNNFSLHIKPFERLGLVGSSGAGKSTIIKLVLRMYDLTSGKITIDGQDISKVTQESLWQATSLVPQEPALFHRSVLENIRYGREDASFEEVIEAAKLAYCHDFIMSLPMQYDTEVGERGVKLSGGERQRIAIARAILKNAPILILDEATSSLDSESEQLIQKALDNLMKGKTVIVIAHRLSTIKKMDRILVLDKGAIVEEGSHTDLMKEEGIYQNLYKIQSEGL